MKETKEAIVLFSGGIDCSLVSLLLRRQAYRVHLLHYNHGAVISNGLHRKRFKELQKLVGEDNIVLTELSHGGIFRKLALTNMEEDFAKYHKSLICLGCRMAMHTESIVYAKKNNISLVSDGSVKYQNHFPEQNNKALNLFIGLYKHFGIEYTTPVSDVESAKDVKYALLDNGISIQSMEDTCLFSNTFTQASEDAITAYIDERIELSKKYINDKLLLVG